MEDRLIEIITKSVLNRLAENGDIPYELTQTQYSASLQAVNYCYENSSKNTDKSQQEIQRETTIMSLLQRYPPSITQ
jgi:hypothetical protein